MTMSILSSPLPPVRIEYPESDGEPITDNTKQFDWIMRIKGGLDIVFRDEAQQLAAEATTKAERLAAQLKALGIEPKLE
jgi:hypothetical protein